MTEGFAPRIGDEVMTFRGLAGVIVDLRPEVKEVTIALHDTKREIDEAVAKLKPTRKRYA